MMTGFLLIVFIALKPSQGDFNSNDDDDGSLFSVRKKTVSCDHNFICGVFESNVVFGSVRA